MAIEDKINTIKSKVFHQVEVALPAILFPPKCVHCGSWGESICKQCARGVDYLTEQYCPACKSSSVLGYKSHGCKSRSTLDQLYSVCWYRGPIRSLVMKMKFRPYNRQTKRFMRTIFQNAFGEEELLAWRGAVVVPVPLSNLRMNSRGFNQAQIIATEIAVLVDGLMQPDILVRQRYLKPQSLMPDVAARHANIRDAFQVSRVYTRDEMPKRILLVDDVYTSGSTLSECARVIKAVNPDTYVSAFTLARG